MNREQSENKKDLFLEEFKKNGKLLESCRNSNVSHQTVYLWLEIDGFFLKSYENIKNNRKKQIPKYRNKKMYVGLNEEQHTKVYKKGGPNWVRSEIDKLK